MKNKNLLLIILAGTAILAGVLFLIPQKTEEPSVTVENVPVVESTNDLDSVDSDLDTTDVDQIDSELNQIDSYSSEF